MDSDTLIGFAVIAAVVLLIVWASRRGGRRGRGSHDYDGAATGAFVFADTSDSSSSCDSGGDSGGGDCGGGGD
jgi:hypothetical protein